MKIEIFIELIDKKKEINKKKKKKNAIGWNMTDVRKTLSMHSIQNKFLD